MRIRSARSNRVRDRGEKVVFIVGPTAVGKTRVASRLAARVNGEIVSCDSMQVYKGMRIISQAPSAVERRSVRHHLVAVMDPVKEYSVAAFRTMATRAIESILRRGKTPIVVGGTGLYAKALIDGLFSSPKADMPFRRQMERFAARGGKKRLYTKLVKIDPESAASIHPNDIRRVIRALEIHHSTGKTMTELKAQTKGLKDRYDIKIFGLTMDREELYSAIGLRVGRMRTRGLLAEVKRLMKRRLSKTARYVLGFREMKAHIDGDCDLETALSELAMNTRRFAKRQLAWFRSDARIVWFDVGTMNDARIVDAIRRSIAR